MFVHKHIKNQFFVKRRIKKAHCSAQQAIAFLIEIPSLHNTHMQLMCYVWNLKNRILLPLFFCCAYTYLCTCIMIPMMLCTLLSGQQKIKKIEAFCAIQIQPDSKFIIHMWVLIIAYGLWDWKKKNSNKKRRKIFSKRVDSINEIYIFFLHFQFTHSKCVRHKHAHYVAKIVGLFCVQNSYIHTRMYGKKNRNFFDIYPLENKKFIKFIISYSYTYIKHKKKNIKCLFCM